MRKPEDIAKECVESYRHCHLLTMEDVARNAAIIAQRELAAHLIEERRKASHFIAQAYATNDPETMALAGVIEDNYAALLASLTKEKPE